MIVGCLDLRGYHEFAQKLSDRLILEASLLLALLVESLAVC